MRLVLRIFLPSKFFLADHELFLQDSSIGDSVTWGPILRCQHRTLFSDPCRQLAPRRRVYQKLRHWVYWIKPFVDLRLHKSIHRNSNIDPSPSTRLMLLMQESQDDNDDCHGWNLSTSQSLYQPRRRGSYGYLRFLKRTSGYPQIASMLTTIVMQSSWYWMDSGISIFQRSCRTRCTNQQLLSMDQRCWKQIIMGH